MPIFFTFTLWIINVFERDWWDTGRFHVDRDGTVCMYRSVHMYLFIYVYVCIWPCFHVPIILCFKVSVFQYFNVNVFLCFYVFVSICLCITSQSTRLRPGLWRTNEKVPFSFKYDFRKLNGSSRRNNCAQSTRDV